MASSLQNHPKGGVIVVERYQLDGSTTLVIEHGIRSVGGNADTICRFSVEKREEPTPYAAKISAEVSAVLGLPICFKKI